MSLVIDGVEIEEDRGVRARVNKRWPIICQAYPRLIDRFGKKHFALDRQIWITYPEYDLIEKLYEQINDRQVQAHRETYERTDAEIHLFNLLCTLTRLKCNHSQWVGNRTADIFVPQVRRLNPVLERWEYGLVIEVDGPSHEKTVKSKKDEAKYHFLARLRIGVIPVRNKLAMSVQADQLIKEIRSYERLDTRGVQRVWTRVCLSTIAAHATDEEFCNLFGLNQRILQHSKSDG